MRITVANYTVAAFRIQRGLSLIELMVSLVIGGLLIAGAVTVYMQSRNTYRTNDVAARMQEIGRYALDVIAPDVRLAGFWGLTNRPDSFTNGAAAVTKDCAGNFTADVAQPIEGRDAEVTGGAGYATAWACTMAAGYKKVNWADVLIVRRGGADPVAFENTRMQIQSNRETAALFSNGALPAGFGAGDLSETHDMMVGVYYVAESTTTLNGMRMFSLRRQSLVAGPALQDEEVISGVQDLQVQFGLDVNGDGTVERYVNPQDAIPAGARVATVQLWLLVVAEEREIGFTDDHVYTYANASQTADVFHDDRRRVLVTKTIQVRNAAT
jgi:type IV pilus assembly protein PilW